MVPKPKAVLAARDLLMRVTPLKSDCGRLCGAACCLGDDETGMLLFPGEQALYEGNPSVRLIKAHYALAGDPALLLVCEGTCRREDRPLACRLFPLFLRFGPDATAHVVIDPRARAVCPLCSSGLSAFDPAFREAVQKAYDLMLEDERCGAFLHALSDMLTL